MTRYCMTKEPSMNEVYSRVNRLAHQLAVIEEMRLRDEILSQVLEARDKGASTTEINQLLDRIGAAGKLVQ